LFLKYIQFNEIILNIYEVTFLYIILIRGYFKQNIVLYYDLNEFLKKKKFWKEKCAILKRDLIYLSRKVIQMTKIMVIETATL